MFSIADQVYRLSIPSNVIKFVIPFPQLPLPGTCLKRFANPFWAPTVHSRANNVAKGRQ